MDHSDEQSFLKSKTMDQKYKKQQIKIENDVSAARCRSILNLSIFIFLVFCVYLYQSKHQGTADGGDSQGQAQEGAVFSYKNPKILKADSLKQQAIKNIKIQNVQFIGKYWKTFTSLQQFSGKLYNAQFQQDTTILQAEYYQLNLKYKLDRSVEEKDICVVAWFDSFEKDSAGRSWKNFMSSINQQNYTNYKVYMIHDVPEKKNLKNIKDFPTQNILKEAKKFIRLNNRLTIIKNVERIGELGSRDQVIRNFCGQRDIILNISPNDVLIGQQVFNLINRIYSNNSNIWSTFANFNNVRVQTTFETKKKKEESDYLISIRAGKDILASNYLFNYAMYRTSDMPVKGYLKTFLKQLYVKIPMHYLFQQESRKYYQEASEHFITYAISELAGLNHTFLIPELLLAHYEGKEKEISYQTPCQKNLYQVNESRAKVLNGLKSLSSLNEAVEKIVDYVVPVELLKNYIIAWKQRKLCIASKSKKLLDFYQKVRIEN